MVASYPANTSYKPNRDAFRVTEPTRPPVVTEFEDGPSMARRSGLSRRAKVSYRIEFKDAADFERFRTFHENTLVDGTARFIMPVYIPASQSYVNRTVMIENGVYNTETFGVSFAITFSLIIFDW